MQERLVYTRDFTVREGGKFSEEKLRAGSQITLVVYYRPLGNVKNALCVLSTIQDKNIIT